LRKFLTQILIFATGVGFGATLSVVGAAENRYKPAYLIVSSNRHAGVTGTDYAPYQAAAGPLARDAGLTMTAAAQQPLVLEGAWSFGNVQLERFDSMAALKNFWYSEAYQEAKKLREGLAQVNFIVAIEGN